MKKKLLKSALTAMAGIGLLAGSALAYSTAADYFTITDQNTESATLMGTLVDFTDALAFYGNGGEFGIYDMNNSANTYAILTSTVDLGQTWFKKIGGVWYVDDNSTVTVADQVFTDTFGFYYKDGSGKHFTDSSLNGNVELFSLDYVPVVLTATFNYAFGNTTGVAGTTTTLTHDITPIPEPATMLLFGAGIAGLARVSRRRKEVLA